MIFFGKPSEGFRVSHLFVLHDKAYRIAALSAAKAMTDATRRRDIERRSTLTMKWAQALIVRPATAQGNKLRNNIHYVCRFLYFFYSRSVYHTFCKDSANREKNKINLFIFYSEVKPFFNAIKDSAKIRLSELNGNLFPFMSVRILCKPREEHDFIVNLIKSSDLFIFYSEVKPIFNVVKDSASRRP